MWVLTPLKIGHPAYLTKRPVKRGIHRDFTFLFVSPHGILRAEDIHSLFLARGAKHEAHITGQNTKVLHSTFLNRSDWFTNGCAISSCS